MKRLGLGLWFFFLCCLYMLPAASAGIPEDLYWAHVGCLYDNANYPQLCADLDGQWYLDLSSVYVNEANPPVYRISAIIVEARAEQLSPVVVTWSYNDKSREMAYNRTEDMEYTKGDIGWNVIPPNGPDSQTRAVLQGGELAWWSCYHTPFYGISWYAGPEP